MMDQCRQFRPDPLLASSTPFNFGVAIDTDVGHRTVGGNSLSFDY